MTGQHTPGPWAMSPETNGQEIVAYSANPWRVRSTVVSIGGWPDNWLANARLISAAPDLLTEAAEVCAILDNYSDHDGETLVYDYAAIGEEVARRHQSLTDAIAKAVQP